MAATPLTPEQEQEMVDAGLEGLIVYIHGKAYREEDLYTCGQCSAQSIHEDDLADGDLCWDCFEAEEQDEDAFMDGILSLNYPEDGDD